MKTFKVRGSQRTYFQDKEIEAKTEEEAIEKYAEYMDENPRDVIDSEFDDAWIVREFLKKLLVK